MCEILIRVTDKVNTDPYLDCKCTKRGDVICVQPNGWPWGNDELTLPFWRILKLPNVTESEAEVFLAAQPEIDPENPSKMLQRRAFYVDLNHVNIVGQLRAYIDDDTRAQKFFTSQITNAFLTSLKTARAYLPDPAVG